MILVFGKKHTYALSLFFHHLLNSLYLENMKVAPRVPFINAE